MDGVDVDFDIGPWEALVSSLHGPHIATGSISSMFGHHVLSTTHHLLRKHHARLRWCDVFVGAWGAFALVVDVKATCAESDVPHRLWFADGHLLS